jgi:putative PIN family toxin of toxin-antitoxin system
LLAVLDSNVLVSAALSPQGAPAELVRRWLAGDSEIVVSPKLLDELARVMAYPKIARRVTPSDASALIRLLEDEALNVNDPEPGGFIVEADSTDTYLLGLAQSRSAALVSGDGHLTALSDRFPVFTPAGFVAHLDRA